MNVAALLDSERYRTVKTSGLDWYSCSTDHLTCCTPILSVSSVTVGHVGTTRWPIKRIAGLCLRFSARDQAIVKAIACESVFQTKLPPSWLSTLDLANEASTALGRLINPRTGWQILATDAIKPWRYQYWIIPRNPKFAENVQRVLDPCAGSWEGKALGHRDYIISSDAKTSIQARIRCHATLPTGPRRPMRVEHEYERGGALQCLAA